MEPRLSRGVTGFISQEWGNKVIQTGGLKTAETVPQFQSSDGQPFSSHGTYKQFFCGTPKKYDIFCQSDKKV